MNAGNDLLGTTVHHIIIDLLLSRSVPIVDMCVLPLQLTARVTQLTAHLKEHRKDFSTTRGLMRLLSRRKGLMEYLKIHDRWVDNRCCACLLCQQWSSPNG